MRPVIESSSPKPRSEVDCLCGCECFCICQQGESVNTQGVNQSASNYTRAFNGGYAINGCNCSCFCGPDNALQTADGVYEQFFF